MNKWDQVIEDDGNYLSLECYLRPCRWKKNSFALLKEVKDGGTQCKWSENKNFSLHLHVVYGQEKKFSSCHNKRSQTLVGP